MERWSGGGGGGGIDDLMKIRSREKISPIFRGCRNQKRKSATVLTESTGILPAATPHLWPWAFEKARQNVKICMVRRRRSVFGMNSLFLEVFPHVQPISLLGFVFSLSWGVTRRVPRHGGAGGPPAFGAENRHFAGRA